MILPRPIARLLRRPEMFPPGTIWQEGYGVYPEGEGIRVYADRDGPVARNVGWAPDGEAVRLVIAADRAKISRPA